MAITLVSDLMSIKAILDTDPYLQSLGYNHKNIFTYDISPDELESDTKMIFIYSAPNDSATSNIATKISYKVEVIATKDKRGDVLNAVEQVIALLQSKDIGNGHILSIDGAPNNLQAPKDIFQVMTRFTCQVTIFNQIKTVATI